MGEEQGHESQLTSWTNLPSSCKTWFRLLDRQDSETDSVNQATQMLQDHLQRTGLWWRMTAVMTKAQC